MLSFTEHRNNAEINPKYFKEQPTTPGAMALRWRNVVWLWIISRSITGRPLEFHQILTTKQNPEYWPNIDHTALYWPNIDRKSSLKSAHLHKKKRISTKYRPHSTLSTKYRPQKFLKKCAFTLFTFKSWDIHILGKWGITAVTILGFWWNIDHFDVICL